MPFSFNPFPVLKTKRLLLRNYSTEDYSQVFFLRSDPALNTYIKRDPPKELKDAIAFVNRVQKSMKNGENVNWAICQKENGQMMGSICLWNFSSDLKTGEVGYDLHPDFQHKGYMNEAIQEVIRFGFQELSLDKITAYTHHSNKNSLKLLEKNNFEIVENLIDEDNKDNIILSLNKSDL